MVKPQNPSRFSTLKVFNFAGGGSKSENDTLIPPPPPPKDRYYLYNKSMSSLSPNPCSLPSTPLSIGFSSSGPSQSTADLHEFGSSLSHPGRSGESSAPGKRSFFRKIASKSRRNPRSATPKTPDIESPEPTDDGISLPWNFQHNIHVDEGLTGLPPSWSTSLSESGFSEDEIAAIQARRANASPIQYPYTDPPVSPGMANQPILANPHPRTTSLPRQYSDTASIASSYRQLSTPPPLPLHSATLRVSPIRKISASSHQHSDSSSFSFETGHPDAQYVYINSRNELTSHAPSESSHVSSEARSQSPVSSSNIAVSHLDDVLGDKRPRTPPRRIFRVVNGSPVQPTSPPPAYKSPAPYSTFVSTSTGGDKSAYREESTETEQPEKQRSLADERVSEEEQPSLPPIKGRLGALPPRLSLHESSDLSSWSESLFSAIPSATGGSILTPASSTSTSSQLSSQPPSASLANSHQSTSASQRPVLATRSTNVADELLVPGPTSGPITPLWNEIMGMVQQQSPPAAVPPNKLTLAPAPYSPTLPATPEQYGSRDVEEEAEEEEEEEEEDVYLSLGLRESNRDSSMSNVTVTGATIVRNASLARRAIANVIDRSPARRRDSGVPKVPGRTSRDEDENDEQDDDEEEEEEEEEELVFPPTPSPTQAGFQPEDNTPRIPSRHFKTASMVSRPLPSLTPPPAQGSPSSSYFSESGSSGYGSDSRTSSSRPNSRGPVCEEDTDKPPELPPKDPELAYLRATSPLSTHSPARSTFSEQAVQATRESFGPSVQRYPQKFDGLAVDENDVTLRGPSIVINGICLEHKDDGMTRTISSVESSTSPSPLSTPDTPGTPPRRYQGWLSEVLAPLEEFIDNVTDPRERYIDLQEIAEAESGSVYAARVVNPEILGLAPEVTFVAIKNVPISPSGSPKLVDLQKELSLIRDVVHENVLTMDALYVDLIEDSLWIRMELMERSLADVVGLVAEGLMVQERMIARFASDVLLALEYLQEKHIAHRDVRSDNLLLNKDGVLKIADFSNAVQVTLETPECFEAAGVIYWQAPEMRSSKPYNALKVDVWSLGATVWETAQAEPPFADVQDPRLIGDRWPTLRQPEIYSRSFHEFLRLCSEPSSTRPDPTKLLNTPFIRNACGRPVNIQLLSQCRAIEKKMLERENAHS